MQPKWSHQGPCHSIGDWLYGAADSVNQTTLTTTGDEIDTVEYGQFKWLA